MSGAFLILLTNDDGIGAPGLTHLERALAPLGRIVTVAPAGERSAASHALTLMSPLRIHAAGDDRYAVDGTTADCILVAMNKILPQPPHLVVSGINAGNNLGDDTVYSGTVAGAREGSMYGIPSVAFSLRYAAVMDFAFWAGRAAALCRRLLDSPLPPGIFLNVNFPDAPPRGVRTTRLSRKFARSSIYENDDPRGMKYYWIGEDESSWDQADDTDFWAVTNGYVSITPLHRDQTSYDMIEAVREAYEQD